MKTCFFIVLEMKKQDTSFLCTLGAKRDDGDALAILATNTDGDSVVLRASHFEPFRLELVVVREVSWAPIPRAVSLKMRLSG